MQNTAATSGKLRSRWSAASRKARAALATVLVAATLVLPPLAAGLLAPPAHAASNTFTVNSASDFADVKVGDGVCDADFATGNLCTLRAAIQEANATTDQDTISFGISGTGVHTISPQTNLPNIINPVSIEGFTQPGSAQNTLSKGTNAKPMIELNGSGVTGTFDSSGLRIGGSGVTVRGLVINRFVGGVFVISGASNVFLEENFIGTDPTGTQDLGNKFGVVDQGFATSIGGPQPQQANVISGNDGPGVSVRSLASSTAVTHNLVGTDKTGTKRLGNSGMGVELAGSSTNNVSANTVAFNGKDGVRISDAAGSASHVDQNFISSNSIFSNVGLGINLIDPNAVLEAGQNEGATPNDPGDIDAGPNGLQNKPVVTSAKKDASGATTIKGKLNSHSGEAYTVEFFKNPKGTNEGKTFLFSRTVSTDGTGNVSFAFKTTKKVALGQTITATAMRASTLETSEFSAPRTVVSV